MLLFLLLPLPLPMPLPLPLLLLLLLSLLLLLLSLFWFGYFGGCWLGVWKASMLPSWSITPTWSASSCASMQSMEVKLQDYGPKSCSWPTLAFALWICQECCWYWSFVVSETREKQWQETMPTLSIMISAKSLLELETWQRNVFVLVYEVQHMTGRLRRSMICAVAVVSDFSWIASVLYVDVGSCG